MPGRMSGVVELPELLVPDAAAWRAWLDVHEGAGNGVWLVLTRKRADAAGLSYDDALDEALCSGWIDGQLRGRDESTFFLRFTPRRRRSPWSFRNTQLVARLAQAGRMRPRGLAEVAAAQADGRWEAAYGGQETAVPDDLLRALAGRPRAQEQFDILTKSNRDAIVYQVATARRPETRARRIRQFVEMLEQGRTPLPQRRSLSGEAD